MTPTSLKEFRKRKRWTQQQAASLLGVSQPYLALLESGQRTLSPRLVRKAVRVYRLSSSLLPSAFASQSEADPEQLARQLAALGYPGFAYLRGGWKRNPVDVLLAALSQPNLEARLTEALPWLLLNYPDWDRENLVRRARVDNLSNKLGFVVDMALQLAERLDPPQSARLVALRALRDDLRASRLDVEGTLGQDALSLAEREWLRKNRSEVAAYWHLLTNWRPEHFPYDPS
jgi:transcriptional regulator with XRE-family HTH domain